MEAGFDQLKEQKKQPSFQQLKEQQQQNLLRTIGDDVLTHEISVELKRDTYDYGDDFINEQVKDQRAFYSDYSRNWNRSYEGYKVNVSAYRDPVDQEISKNNFKFFEKYEKKVVKDKQDEWNELMKTTETIKTADFKHLDENKLPTQTTIRVDTTYNGFKLLKKPNANTYAIMKSTVRMKSLENTRIRIVNEIADKLVKSDEDKQKYRFTAKYINAIMALGPQIKIKQPGRAPGNDDKAGQQRIDDFADFALDQESVQNFRAFVEKAFQNPAETLATAITDSLNSFDEVSMNMLERHALPQKLDEAKHLRDKYKAITDLFADSITKDADDDPVLGQIKELRENRDLIKRDNMHLAEILYKSLDADMRYSLLHNGVDFVDDGSFLDEVAHNSSYYSENVKKAKGELTRQLFTKAKGMVTGKGRRAGERFWEKECIKLLAKDEDEKKEEFKDDYSLAKAITNINFSMRDKVESDNNRDLFDSLCQKGNKIALAIFNIDQELINSKDVFKRRKDELNVRPGLEGRLHHHIEKRKQEQLDLLDRANGVINALKYLAGQADLEENGKLVLDEARTEIETVTVDLTENEELARTRTEDFDKVGLRALDRKLFGAHRNLNELARDPKTFDMLKKELSERFKEEKDLDKFLAMPNLSVYLDLLTIQKVDMESLDFAQLKSRVEEVSKDQELRGKIVRAAEITMRREIDSLFVTMTKGDFNKLSEKDRADVIDQYKNLQQRVYCINRLSKLPNGDKAYKDNINQNSTLRTYFNLKFKEISDCINVYKYQELARYASHSSLSEDMMTKAEWQQVENERKKAVVLKDGNYKDGKSSDMLVLEFMLRKSHSAINLKHSHLREYINLTRNSPIHRDIYILIKRRLQREELDEQLRQKKNEHKALSLTDDEDDEEEELQTQDVRKEIDLDIEDDVDDLIQKFERDEKYKKNEIEMKEKQKKTDKKKEEQKEEEQKEEELKQEGKKEQKKDNDDDDDKGYKAWQEEVDDMLKEEEDRLAKIGLINREKKKEEEKKKKEEEKKKKVGEEEDKEETMQDFFTEFLKENGYDMNGRPIKKEKPKQEPKKKDQTRKEKEERKKKEREEQARKEKEEEERKKQEALKKQKEIDVDKMLEVLENEYDDESHKYDFIDDLKKNQNKINNESPETDEEIQKKINEYTEKENNDEEIDLELYKMVNEQLPPLQQFDLNQVSRYLIKYDKMPEFKTGDGYFDNTCDLFRKFLLAKNLEEINKVTSKGNINKSFKDAGGAEPALQEIMITTGSMLDTKTLQSYIVDKAEKDRKSTEKVDVKEADFSVSMKDPDILWIMNELSQCKKVADMLKLRGLWNDRKRFYESQATQIDPMVYHKVDVLLDKFKMAYSRLEDKTLNQAIVDSLSKYKAKASGKDLDLKKNDKEKTYDFKQHQKETLSCWAASHTYVVNTYMKVHGIKAKSFKEGSFKDEANFTPHPLTHKWINDKSDKNAKSMSFNQEADNIHSYLTQNKVGNPYTVADSVITKLPKTAERHMVFNFFKLNRLETGQKTIAVKKLTSYILDRVENELERTKVPISCLQPGHYLSIVGVDRKTNSFKTMDSRNEGDELNNYKMLKISDLIQAGKFELTFPEYLDEKNMAYLSEKFGLGENLYNEGGDMVVTGELQKKKDEFLTKPQNMMHVQGYEFDAVKHDNDFESDFVEDQIYMPRSLNLPQKIAKENKKK